jgi:phosphatidylglycerol---prolipoprotein diacylglyceryl transferase
VQVASITFEPVQRVFGISPHGVGSALGFLLGATLLVRELRRRGFDTAIAERALTWSILGAIVGARVDYVISQPQGFLDDGLDGLLRIPRVWEGGLALFGGFAGGVAFALPTLVRHRVHLPRFLDAAAPGFALGVVIGRIGDLVIWDHLGDRATGWTRAFGFLVKEGYDLAPGFGPSPAVTGPCEGSAVNGQFFAGCVYHQPALYDLLGALVLLLVLLRLRAAGRHRAGVAILLWGAWYGMQRFVIDFTRSGVDEHIPVVELTGTQALGLLLFLVCTVQLVRIRLRGIGLQEASDDPPSREGALHHPEPEADYSLAGSDASSTPSA